ncbi:MAG: peptidylprolyl isomerase [Alphaproteobacteria bacterium]
MPRLSHALAVLAILLPATAVPGLSVAQTEPDIPVAVVDGQKIMRSTVLREYESLPDSIKQQGGLEAIYPRLLDRIIQQQLLVTEGRKKNMAKDPDVIARMKYLEDAVIGEFYLNRLIEQNMAPDFLENQYKAFLAQNPPTEQVHARHILLKTETDATNVIGHLAAGKDFEDAAKEFSTGPSAPNGGDLGFFKREDMVKPFADAAFAMKAGEISKAPVKTRFGYHVIQVVERRTNEPPSFEEMKPQLMQRAGRNVAIDVMSKLMESANVERFELDGTPMESAPTVAPNP